MSIDQLDEEGATTMANVIIMKSDVLNLLNELQQTHRNQTDQFNRPSVGSLNWSELQICMDHKL